MAGDINIDCPYPTIAQAQHGATRRESGLPFLIPSAKLRATSLFNGATSRES
jgi:hypothetical protein